MRVTAATKEATKRAILDAAKSLFRSQGFEETTTRDLAREAGIGVGTLFNYFPAKEAIALRLVAQALEKADSQYLKRRRAGASLEEDLFQYVAMGLRSLKPLRKFLQPALDAGFGSVAIAADDADTARISHLEQVGSILLNHDIKEPLSAQQSQMYWVLYVGVLSFWTKDSSRKQEDTLAMLDQATSMFVDWIRKQDEQ